MFFVLIFSLLTRESIGKEAELEMKLAIVSNALMKVCTIFFLQKGCNGFARYEKKENSTT